MVNAKSELLAWLDLISLKNNSTYCDSIDRRALALNILAFKRLLSDRPSDTLD